MLSVDLLAQICSPLMHLNGMTLWIDPYVHKVAELSLRVLLVALLAEASLRRV